MSNRHQKLQTKRLRKHLSSKTAQLNQHNRAHTIINPQKNPETIRARRQYQNLQDRNKQKPKLLLPRSEIRSGATHQLRPTFPGRDALPAALEALPRQVDQREGGDRDEEDGGVRGGGAEPSPVEPEPPPSAPRHFFFCPSSGSRISRSAGAISFAASDLHVRWILCALLDASRRLLSVTPLCRWALFLRLPLFLSLSCLFSLGRILLNSIIIIIRIIFYGLVIEIKYSSFHRFILF